MASTNFMKWDQPGIAIITGASSGIGAEFARQLGMQGFNLILAARRKELLEKLSDELTKNHDIHVDIVIADLARSEDTDKLCNHLENVENIDILVNNAGFGLPGGFLNNKIDRMMDMCNVHMISPLKLCDTVIPKMVKRGRGAIVNVASSAAFNPAPGLYSPTKAFLTSFSEGLAMELKRKGIQVQALCPGFTHTGFHDTSPELKQMKESLPRKIWGTVDNVVKTSLIGLCKGKDIVIPGLINKFLLSFPKTIRKNVTMKKYKA